MTRTTALPGRPQLETLAQAEAQNLRRIDALIDRAPDIAATLETCTSDAFCCLVICAICSRRYRFRFIRRLLAISRSSPGQHQIATIYLATFPAGTLAAANIAREHDRLRKRLKRNGFGESILIGGTEANWDSTENVWILHVHLLAIGVPPPRGRGSAGRCAASGRSFPSRCSVSLIRSARSRIRSSSTHTSGRNRALARADQRSPGCLQIAWRSWPRGGPGTPSTTSSSCSGPRGEEVESSSTRPDSTA